MTLNFARLYMSRHKYHKKKCPMLQSHLMGQAYLVKTPGIWHFIWSLKNEQKVKQVGGIQSYQ